MGLRVVFNDSSLLQTKAQMRTFDSGLKRVSHDSSFSFMLCFMVMV
jgi:hypothetical protein